jgi:hypothetical protein
MTAREAALQSTKYTALRTDTDTGKVWIYSLRKGNKVMVKQVDDNLLEPADPEEAEKYSDWRPARAV